MTREEQINEKVHELGQACFPDECNIWARENYESQKVEWACKQMVEWADEHPKKGMVSLEKVEEWLYKNFYESYNLNDYGKYDLDKPYIASLFDTINEMFDDFRKTMEE